MERDGVPVDASAWQSRKARDLVKVLVARRGHRVSRDVLMELLWPEEPPERLHNRLSVALATARGVLGAGPDPSTSAVIKADGESVWLDRDAVVVDVESFLSATSKALAQARTIPMPRRSRRCRPPRPPMAVTSWKTMPTPSGQRRCGSRLARHTWR